MPRLILPLFALLLLAGCAAYDTQVARGPGLAGVERFFVVGNANDNRGLEHRLVAALRARGFTAAAGPRTMMPEDTQAVVTYDDRWAWDFGERLQYLQISVNAVSPARPLAAAVFSAKIPGRKAAAEIVDELVGRLVAEGKP